MVMITPFRSYTCTYIPTYMVAPPEKHLRKKYMHIYLGKCGETQQIAATL